MQGPTLLFWFQFGANRHEFSRRLRLGMYARWMPGRGRSELTALGKPTVPVSKPTDSAIVHPILGLSAQSDEGDLCRIDTQSRTAITPIVSGSRFREVTR